MRLRSINFVHFILLLIKYKNIFNKNDIPHDLIYFGTGLKYIFIPKKI